MFDKAIEELKKFDWDTILTNALSVEALNLSQWRFLKALVIELSLEKYSHSRLVYVAGVHKDFDWPELDLTADQKGSTSTSMYKQNGFLRKRYNILLNNSMGTNKKETLDKSEICDIIICVYNDGVFVIGKEMAQKYLIKKGDGFGISIPSKDIIEITGRKYITTRNEDLLGLQDDVIKMIVSRI